MYQSGYASPKKGRWPALLQHRHGASCNGSPIRARARRLQPRLNDIERIGEVTPDASRGRPRDHIA